MAIAAQRSETYQFSGDVTYNLPVSISSNADSPGITTRQALSSGANTITVPTPAPHFCTIVPPSGNTVQLTLKGVAGDTGVALHLTQPTTLALGSGVSTFVINAANTVTVRLIWA